MKLIFFCLLPFITLAMPNPNNDPGEHQDPERDHRIQYELLTMPLQHNHRQSKFCHDKPAGNNSLGACRPYYAYCDANNLTIKMCNNGEVFHTEDSKCVELREAQCTYKVDPGNAPCINTSNELVVLHPCNIEYAVCYQEKLYHAVCLEKDQAFSSFSGVCRNKGDISACINPPPTPPVPKEASISYCKPFTSLCEQSTHGDTKTRYFGACNEDYMECQKVWKAEVMQCKKGADGTVENCVRASQPEACPTHPDDSAEFVSKMNTIIKSKGYCQGKDSGLYSYLDCSSSCRREIVFCNNEEGSFHLCPLGTGLDDKGWCSPNNTCSKDHSFLSFLAAFGSDPTLCSNTTGDSVYDFGLCRIYGVCESGHFTVEHCQNPQQIFDPSSKMCRPVKPGDNCNVNPISTTKAPTMDRCKDPNEVNVHQLKGKCDNAFTMCMNGSEIEVRCREEGQAFHIDKNCLPKTAHPDCPEDRGQAVPEPTKCESDEGRLKGDDCSNEFLKCIHHQFVYLSCQHDMVFDKANKICVKKNLMDRCKKK